MNVLILNRTAGRGDAGRHEHEAVTALRNAGVAFDLLHTEAPEHATELARQAASEGASCIIAAGGDGTVHEVASGMWNSDAVLGVLPMGSGNDFAQAHGIPKKLDEAAVLVRDGTTGLSDVGRFGDRTFFNSLGIGFDAEVSVRSRRIRRLKGDLMYLVAVLGTFRHYRAPMYRIEAPDYQRNDTTYMITVAIGQREGGGFTLAPDALIDDGLFDLCVVDDIPIRTAVRMIPRAMKGTHTNLPFVTMLRVPHVTIDRGAAIILHADGQIYEVGSGRLEVTCEPRALRVRMAPQ